MSLFLITFFLIYGGVHYYFFRKAAAAVPLTGSQALLLALFLGLMVIAPVAVRLLERAGHETAARFTAYAGYCWMGLLFLFFSASLLVDLCRLLLRLGRLVYAIPLPWLLAPRPAFFLCLGLAAAISLYGWFEALHIRTERLTIPTAKLPATLGRVRIVQISDVHVGLIVRGERMRRIVAAVKSASPDLVVSTGDLVDGHVGHFEEIPGMFRELAPRFGMFAVTGNHEYYAGLRQALDFTERAGFRLLRGEAATVAGGLTIAGVDDPAGKLLGDYRGADERALLAPLPRDRFTLFLKHRPVVSAEARNLFDLQLSGHVHKGQIFPFTLLTWLNFPVRAGLTPLAGGGLLYLSRGTGTWGPPIRFLAPPEVTVIDLVPAQPR